jgi:hypothetical protein
MALSGDRERILTPQKYARLRVVQCYEQMLTFYNKL